MTFNSVNFKNLKVGLSNKISFVPHRYNTFVYKYQNIIVLCQAENLLNNLRRVESFFNRCYELLQKPWNIISVQFSERRNYIFRNMTHFMHSYNQVALNHAFPISYIFCTKVMINCTIFSILGVTKHAKKQFDQPSKRPCNIILKINLSCWEPCFWYKEENRRLESIPIG